MSKIDDLLNSGLLFESDDDLDLGNDSDMNDKDTDFSTDFKDSNEYVDDDFEFADDFEDADEFEDVDEDDTSDTLYSQGNDDTTEYSDDYEDDDDIDDTVDTDDDAVSAHTLSPAGDDTDNEVGSDDVDDIVDDDDDFSPSDMSDDELLAMDAELGGSAVNDDDDDEGEVHLTPDEEIKADDMMSVAATTMLVKDELNKEEKADFVVSSGDIAINEGFMTQADVRDLAIESGVVTENKKFYNKNTVRMTKAARYKQLYALAVNVSAAAHNDPDYRKLKKVMALRKILRAKLERKYHAEATKRARIYMRRLSQSKSPALQKLAKK